MNMPRPRKQREVLHEPRLHHHVRGLYIEPRAAVKDDCELIAPEVLNLFDIAFGVEQGHMRDVWRSQPEISPVEKFVVAFRIGQVLRQQLREEGAAAASR